ncbi:DUF1492 domain-containing protein [Streptococcus hillyeri]|uniref:DUF1492 domain-containing protein n=1 Tax=Streptococcus hillyeri TaxID=2282420 RepID=A0A3L9DWD3_9STRE|nr:DUF1492 domain-containing protein [Streptococcus hillyeri]RLY03090.1 DUF1492 domain-containing protein [Streptococcus hillyeri]
MARKEITEAEKLLKELQTIPKIITELKLDIERTESSLLSSPQWSDMRVSSGLRKSQEDKNISIIDTSDYNREQIDKLLKRKQEIIEVIDQLDAEYRLLIIRAYISAEYPSDCIGKYYTERKFYTVKRLAIKQLDAVLCSNLQ